jgi:hypothetical protein
VAVRAIFLLREEPDIKKRGLVVKEIIIRVKMLKDGYSQGH